MTELKKDKLFNAVKNLIEESRRSIAKQVNTAMVFTYYHIGKMIVEDEQDGKEKAQYSSETLKQLSLLLTKRYFATFYVNLDACCFCSFYSKLCRKQVILRLERPLKGGRGFKSHPDVNQSSSDAHTYCLLTFYEGCRKYKILRLADLHFCKTRFDS
jgi:hypothetical protein